MLRIRRFALVALLVAVAAPATRAADVDPLLPAETEGVMYLNVKQMLDSDLMKKYALPKIKEAMKAGEASAILEKLGLDPLKDISSVSAGLWGENPEEMKGLGIIRGTFDGEKLLKAAEEFSKMAGDKMSMVEEGDYKMVKFVGENGKPGFASVSADNKTIVISTEKKLVATALTAQKNKAKAALNKDLTALILKQDDKASMYMCGMTAGRLNNLPGNLNGIPGVDGDALKDQLSKMQSAAVTLRVGKEVSLEITAGMKDADAADGFGASADKLIGLAKTFIPLAAGNIPPEFKPIVDDVSKSLTHTVKKTDVTISLKISGDAITKAAGSGDKDK